MGENVNGPGENPSRERFSLNKGSVAPALRLLARFVGRAAVVVVGKLVVDWLLDR